MLYGRDVERARIWALLEAARASQSGALVLRGEAGIGKSALLEDARDRAADMHVLAARGIESESDLPFAALHQLLRPALEHADLLPEPQSAALKSALGLGEAGGQQRFLVFAACLTLLSELAEHRPVLCLVDDAHWLDSASSDALQFVARRLGAEGIVLLFAAREGDVRTFEAVDILSLTLQGLDADAAATLLDRAGGEASSSIRAHLIEQSRGNALALIELPSALSPAQLAGDEPLPDALPITDQVGHVFLERVRRLPDEAQRALLVAAADDTEDAGLVVRAAGFFGADAEAFDLAEAAGLVSVHGTRLRFRHPLVRSAIYEAAPSSERRAAHRALADALALDDGRADRRAWHLAASVIGYDEEAAMALEQAAERAEERAGYMAAARALARAAELSADREAHGRRLIGAVRAARTVGADEYALELSAQAQPLVDDPHLRAEIAYASGVAAFRRGRPLDGASRLIEAARDVSEADPDRALELLIWATGAATTGGDPAALAEISQLAAATALRGGDEGSAHVADALAAIAHVRGGGVTEHLLEEALVWASASRDAWRVFSISVATLFLGDDQRSARLIDRAVLLARANGELGVLGEALAMRAAQLRMGQRFEEAEIAAGEGMKFAQELGAVNVAARCKGIIAYIAALRGEDERARRDAGEALQLAVAHGLPLVGGSATYTLAFVDLGRGRWADALEHLNALADGHPSTIDPVMARFALPDTIEAAVRAGRPGEAAEALSAYEAWEAQAAVGWQRPRLLSCRALLADGDEATALFEEAIALRADTRPFDFARILLLYGEHLRRERRRADSRVQLRAALEGFEQLRAEPWAERARTELGASGETARKRDPSLVDQLTPQERQISRLVAEGMTNKEIAAQLFLSPRTIDSHLRNVFAKLGVTSRTQLARMRLEGDDTEPLAVG